MLINCVAYDHGSKLADIDVRDISEYLRKPDCFVWVALRDPTNEELGVMQAEFGLHDLAVEDARNGQQRPKVEEYEQTLFVVMQTLELDPLDELRVGEVDVFAGRNFVLSIRNRSSQSLLGVRQRTAYHLVDTRRIPFFRMGKILCARRSRLLAAMEAMETA